jgi:hypothetical protein
VSRPLASYIFAGPVIVLSGKTAWVLARAVRLEDLAAAVRHDEALEGELLALQRLAISHGRDVTSKAGFANGAVTSNETNQAALTQQGAPSTCVGVAQAARIAGIGGPAVRAAIRRQRLPAVKVDGEWRIEPADLAVYGRTKR